MDFLEHVKGKELELFNKTSQSSVFKIKKRNNLRLCKHYSNHSDKTREELAYKWINERRLLNLPELICSGEDFIEFEFIDGKPVADLSRIVPSIFPLYNRTFSSSLNGAPFQKLNLSPEKSIERLSSLNDELIRRGISFGDLVLNSKKIVSEIYSMPQENCVVHGDLKSPHVIEKEGKVYFIDLALTSIGNPWYDLSFLYMEKRDKSGVLDNLERLSLENMADNTFSRKNVKLSLASAVLNRSIYRVLYASRHYPDDKLKRTIKELNEIIAEMQGFYTK